MIPIYVFTNDNHLWLLRGFCYLWNDFWGVEQTATVVGYSPPAFNLPGNFEFQSISQKNYGKQQWSDGIIEFIQRQPSKFFIMMLEDYWLYTTVGASVIRTLATWMKSEEENVLRMDLTADRSSKAGAKFHRFLDGYTIISTPPPSKYRMSFQAGIWNRDLMLEILKPGENPWQAEIEGTKRLNKRSDLKVLGTKIHPLKYQPVYRTHRDAMQLQRIPRKYIQMFRKWGWLTRERNRSSRP